MSFAEDDRPLSLSELAAHIGRLANRRLEDKECLDILVRPGNASAEEIAEFFCLLSAFYRLLGGLGLTFSVFDTRGDIVRVRMRPMIDDAELIAQ